MGRSFLIFGFFVSLIIILMFSSCTEQRIVYVDSDDDAIDVEDTSDGINLKVYMSENEEQSQIPRPIGSSAAGNNVNTVKIYAFSKNKNQDDSKYVLDRTVGVETGINADGYNISSENGVILITGFVSDEGEHNPSEDITGHEDQVCTVNLKGLQNVQLVYQFVAVGYNAGVNNENPYGEPTSGSISINGDAGTDKGVFMNCFTTSIPKQGYIESDGADSRCGFDVEELYAGLSGEIQPLSLGDNEIRLTRQVAGMLGYFINIPTKAGGEVVKYLRVYADRTYKHFTYPAVNSGMNGVWDGDYGEQRQLLLEFDMEKIANNWEPDAANQTSPMYMFYSGEDDSGFVATDSDSDTENTAEDGLVPPLAEGYVAPPGLKLVPNSIFGGRFVIPYYASGVSGSDGSTITIVLQNEQGQDLRTYKVYMSDEEDAENGKNYYYGIKCNNFYSLGSKTSTESCENDKPLDLGAGSELIVTIDDGWDDVHQLDYDDEQLK